MDVSKIPLDDSLTLGLATAKKKVIVFTDPDCPYCRELHEIMKQIVAKHSDIAFTLIMNPLPMHKDSPKKAQTILCTKSLDVLDDAFSGKTVPEPPAPAPLMRWREARRSPDLWSSTAPRHSFAMTASCFPVFSRKNSCWSGSIKSSKSGAQMRLVRFQVQGRTAYGILQGEVVQELEGNPFGTLTTLPTDHALAGVKLLAPCSPTKVIAVGLNYRDHAQEMGMPIPDTPIIFLKPPTTVIGPGDAILYPAMSSQVDYEAELGIVIKDRAKDISPEEARGAYPRLHVRE